MPAVIARPLFLFQVQCCARSLRRLLILLVLFTTLRAEDGAVKLPPEIVRAEETHAKVVEKAITQAREDIEESKSRLIKSLEKEIKSSVRSGDLALAKSLQDRVNVLKEVAPELPAPTNSAGLDQLFGQAQVVVADDPGIVILSDDASLYTWSSGLPLLNKECKQEGTTSFIATGNNHFPLKNSFTIGNQKDQIRTFSFYVFLEDKNSALMLQFNIGGSWNNRMVLDGRETYQGSFTYHWTKTLVNVETHKWVKIEVDLMDTFAAAEGAVLSHVAFTGNSPKLFYDNVRVHSH